MKSKSGSSRYHIVAHYAQGCGHELLVHNKSGFVHVLIDPDRNMRIEQAHSISMHSVEINISQILHFFSPNMKIVSPPLELEEFNENGILAVLNNRQGISNV